LTIRTVSYLIDSWDNEDFIIYADGQEIYKLNHNLNNAGTTHICGDSRYKDYRLFLTTSSPHTADTL
jgi:hypothetical protein